MLEFQEKRKVRKFLYCKTTVFVLLILIVFLLNGVWNVYQKQVVSKDNMIKTASGLEGLKKREKMLESEIEKLSTLSGVEEEIRERYGLIRPNEEVIVVVDESDGEVEEAHNSINSFWQKIKDWLK